MDELAKLVNGEEKSYHDSKFLYVERSLDEVYLAHEPHRPIIEYIRRNIQNIYAGKRISERFPGIGINLTTDLVFLDIETNGFPRDEMINTVSLAVLNGSLKMMTYFARNPFEEEAIIASTVEQILPPNVSVFTYNGVAFDLDRTNARSQMWGLLDKGVGLDRQLQLFSDYATPLRMAKNSIANGNGSTHATNGNANKNYLKKLIGKRHYDLKPKFNYVLEVIGKKTRGRKLQTLEKMIFGVHRSKDVKGEKIPEIYHKYTHNGGNEDQVAKIIEHNILDVVTLIGLLAYVCTE